MLVNSDVVKAARQRMVLDVAEAGAALSSIIDGNFGPGYFNRPEVLNAEKRGLHVTHGVLAHAPRSYWLSGDWRLG